MGTIINLYVIPRHQDPSNLRAGQVAEALVSEHLVAPPVVIGPALGAHGHQDWLVTPQGADDPHRLIGLGASVTADDADFVRRSRRYTELPRTFADFGTTDGPQIAAFTRLDETNPAIRSDFSHYTGRNARSESTLRQREPGSCSLVRRSRGTATTSQRLKVM